MDANTLMKLINNSFPKTVWNQVNIKIRPHSGTGSTVFGRTVDARQHSKFSETSPTAKGSIKISLNKRHIQSLKLKTYFSQHVLFPNINPDIMFLTNKQLYSTMPRKINFLKLNCARPQNFSTSPNNSNFWNKLIPHENPTQVPTKLFTHKAEAEPLVLQGVGWAGQPIVKRIHPVLPEVYGDVSDIFNSWKDGSKSAETGKSTLTSSHIQTSTVDMQLRTPDLCTQGLPENANADYYNTSSNNIKGLVYAEETKNRVRSHDTISFINEDIKSQTSEDIVNAALNLDNIGSHGDKKTQKQSLTKKEKKSFKKGPNFLINSGVIMKNPKKKIRKKTKVCRSTTDFTINSNKVKITKKKKKVKGLQINKKIKLQPQFVLSQRVNTQSLPKNVMLMENRQLKTASALNLPKASVRVKEKKTEVVAKSKKSGSEGAKEGSFEDYCECPDTSVKGKRKGTKICGEATGEGEKKKKKWKGKMCPVESLVKRRQRTVVCASKIKKDKRKRELPKCVKPDKKPIPRVVICPPKIEELKDKSKLCEKQVEEIKIRKRTTVCKPVIIYGKEVTEIKVEKAICSETRVKRKISRHTKICPPPDEKNKKSQAKH